MPLPPPTSFDEILRARAERDPHRRAYGAWGAGEVSTWLDYGELDRRARAIAGELQARGLAGERALLLFPPGFDYTCAFFGCLYAQVIAVPAYPPEPARVYRTLPRLAAIVADAQATVVLTHQTLLALRTETSSVAPQLAAARWIAIDDMIDAERWRPTPRDPDHLALLQYTSGSTGAPKGVMVSHGNLLHNCAALAASMRATPDTLQVSWLPPYHDMGLIAGMLLATFVGFPLVTLSPMDFLLHPFRWLDAVSRTGAHITGAPNFAFELCVEKISEDERANLDLSDLQFAYVSAEPVRATTLERFSAAFADCGFDPRALVPTYGLAEATLVATGGAKGSGVRTTRLGCNESGGDVVSVGRCATEGGELAIVDPAGEDRLPDGEIGEVWLRGPSNARGYWNRPDDSRATFDAQLDDEGGWLRSGDLGFVRGGDLYLTGRLKEVIVIRGRTYFPSDLEDTVDDATFGESYYRAGGCVTFAADLERAEQLCVAVEVERRLQSRRIDEHRPAIERRRGDDRRSLAFRYRSTAPAARFDEQEVVDAIRAAITAAHGVEPWMIMLLRPGAVPKTSSGKKRRLHCREIYLGDTPHPDVLYRWRTDER